MAFVSKTSSATDALTTLTTIFAGGTAGVCRNGQTGTPTEYENRQKCHCRDDRQILKTDTGDSDEGNDSDRRGVHLC